MKWYFPLLLVASLAVQAARVPWATNHVQGSPEPPAPYAVERLFPELELQSPVEFLFAPDSRDLFIATQQGQIWHVDTSTSPATQHLVANMRDHHDPVGSVLGFAFHPEFQKNRYIFINYNEPGERDLGAHIARFEISEERPYQLIPESKKVLIRWPSGGHNGCTLAFGKDGYLYFSTGDGAVPDPPDSRYYTGQDNSDIMASIQRIDVNREANGKPYAIPPDNPFVNTKNTRPEIWAFGFRNPFRIAFDQNTGELWVGDVGWEQWEMIYWIQRGGNYGWSATEGPNPRVLPDRPRGPGPILPPMVSHPHSEAASMTGGQVYYGSRYPDLHGAYIYGDWETGRIWALRNRADQLVSHRELCDTSLKPVSFALDPDGELLILDHNSGIYGLVPNRTDPSKAPFPTQLSETGLFTQLDPLTPAAGTVPYQPIAPMWNDYAQAQWLLGVPGSDQIAQRGGVRDIAGDNWSYPTNTVLARTLTLRMNQADPQSARRIETQMLHWDGQEWNPYTYRWNDDETDATLVGKNGDATQFTVTDNTAPGGIREINWKFHSRSECLRCHNVWSGIPLTLNTLQLGRGSESELERLTKLELIAANDRGNRRRRRGAIPATLVNPYEAAHPVASRARSWLHVNCSSCHIFGAGGGIPSQFNIDKRLSEARAVDAEPTRGTFNLANARILASGSPFESVVSYRISTEGAGHMPQIGSRLVDEVGVEIVMDWLLSLDQDPSARALRTRAESAFSQGSLPALKPLLQSTEGSLALIHAGTQQRRSAWLRPHIARLARKESEPLVRDLFESWLPSEERRQTLGTEIDPRTILSLTGNALRGQDLFFGRSQCASCHALNGQGRAFGPDLKQTAARYNREALLDHILNPSKTVDPEYRTVSFTLQDDTELSGLVQSQDSSGIVLIDSALTEHRIPSAQIVDRFDSTLSAMPEGLLTSLTAQEAADLLSYLTSLKL